MSLLKKTYLECLSLSSYQTLRRKENYFAKILPSLMNYDCQFSIISYTYTTRHADCGLCDFLGSSFQSSKEKSNSNEDSISRPVTSWIMSIFQVSGFVFSNSFFPSSFTFPINIFILIVFSFR